MIKLNPQKRTDITQPYSGNYFTATPDTYHGLGQIDIDAKTERLMQNNNIAKKSSDQYQQSINQEPTDLVAKPSSLRKQASIAHTYDVATSDVNEL